MPDNKDTTPPRRNTTTTTSPSNDEPELELWSQNQLDYLLNTILPADSHPRFMGLAEVVAKAVDRTSNAVRRITWGLACRITSIGYTAGPVRYVRSGPPTFMDIQMIHWATVSHTKDDRRKNGPADAEYMARVLGRTEEDMKELWRIYGPARGRKKLWEK